MTNTDKPRIEVFEHTISVWAGNERVGELKPGGIGWEWWVATTRPQDAPTLGVWLDSDEGEAAVFAEAKPAFLASLVSHGVQVPADGLPDLPDP